MNHSGKPFKNNQIKEIKKTLEIKVKVPHVNKRPLARKQT